VRSCTHTKCNPNQNDQIINVPMFLLYIFTVLPEYYSPAVVLVPVILGVLAVSGAVFAVAYIHKLRKVKNVETADFDFHPSLDLLDSTAHTPSLWATARSRIGAVFSRTRNNYASRHTHAKTVPVTARQYGSMTEIL
jgi:hypothetical protein